MSKGRYVPLDPTLYAARSDGSLLLPARSALRLNSPRPHPWIWCSRPATYPASREHVHLLTSSGWERIGKLAEMAFASAVLYGQLVDLCLLHPEEGNEQDGEEVWVPGLDKQRVERLPVILAFTLSENKTKKVDKEVGSIESDQVLPPPQFGELGLILASEGTSTHWICCSLQKLPVQSQQIQRRIGNALSTLAGAQDLPRSAWLKQWGEIQAMAWQLAADYWHAYQESQRTERPQPINVFKDGLALAPLTMIQEGAHAGIYHKDRWKQEHLLEQGQYQGLMLPRYIHTTGKKQKNSTEYWMQHPEDANIPLDPALASQEVLSLPFNQ